MSFCFVVSWTEHVYVEGFQSDWNQPEFDPFVSNYSNSTATLFVSNSTAEENISMKYSVQFSLTWSGGALLCVWNKITLFVFQKHGISVFIFFFGMLYNYMCSHGSISRIYVKHSNFNAWCFIESFQFYFSLLADFIFWCDSNYSVNANIHIVRLPGVRTGSSIRTRSPPLFSILGTLNVSKKMGGHSRAVALVL